MREIVLDTETTGIDVTKGNKIIEIGCVELFDKIPTGRNYQVYLNPEVVLDEENIKIHGLTNNFLRNKPVFQEIAVDFLKFIGKTTIIAHNAQFDIDFINMELLKIGFKELTNPVIDTLKIARRRFPNAYCSLDALCKRFNIDINKRVVHGALIDSELLAKVYYFLSTIEDSFDCFQPMNKEEVSINNFVSNITELTENESKLNSEMLDSLK